MTWHTVDRADVLEPLGRALVRLGGQDIVVLRQAGVLHAFSDSCPHSGASLCSGKMVGGHIQCPAHGLRFRLTDGLLAGSPPGSHASSLGVRVYCVRIQGEDLQIATQP